MWKSVITLFGVVVFMMSDIQARSIEATGSSYVANTTEVDSSATVQAATKQNLVPDHFEVRQNYPNPFNATTTIEYDLPEGAGVYAVVYNILGHRIKTLENVLQRAGRHELQWNGSTDSGHEAASGVYFYVLLADDNYSTGKMLLLK